MNPCLPIGRYLIIIPHPPSPPSAPVFPLRLSPRRPREGNDEGAPVFCRTPFAYYLQYNCSYCSFFLLHGFSAPSLLSYPHNYPFAAVPSSRDQLAAAFWCLFIWCSDSERRTAVSFSRAFNSFLPFVSPFRFSLLFLHFSFFEQHASCLCSFRLPHKIQSPS